MSTICATSYLWWEKSIAPALLVIQEDPVIILAFEDFSGSSGDFSGVSRNISGVTENNSITTNDLTISQ